VTAPAWLVVGAAPGRLRAWQPPRRAGLPAAVSILRVDVPGQRLAPDVLPRRAAGAAVALHPREGEGIGRLARAQDRLGHLPQIAAEVLAAVRLPRAADDDDELHVARHAGHVSDASRHRRLRKG